MQWFLWKKKGTMTTRLIWALSLVVVLVAFRNEVASLENIFGTRTTQRTQPAPPPLQEKAPDDSQAVAITQPSFLVASDNNNNNNNNNNNGEESLSLPLDVDTILVKPRAFEQWHHEQPEQQSSLPCLPPDGNMVGRKVYTAPDHRKPVAQGLFFVKTHKTASSTVAGVALRISRRLALRRHTDAAAATTTAVANNFDFCKLRFCHARPAPRPMFQLFTNRTVGAGESLLWAVIRHPTARAVSMFYHFEVSMSRRRKAKVTTERFINWAQEGRRKDYYITALSPEYYATATHEKDWTRHANGIMQKFDFIGVTERLDESFVALSMLLGLPLSDFLYLSAKVGGGYDGNCKPIKKTVMLPGMDTFLEGDVWYNQIKNDLALYKAVNQSLDLTIDRLGREEFTQNLMQYQKMLAAANDICPNRTVYHCTENGKKIPANQTDCIWFDVGCGDPCLDDVAASFGM